MNLKLILAKTGLVLKQASPELLTGGGIILSIAALITACSKMKETEEVNEEIQDEIETIQDEEERGTKEYVGRMFKLAMKVVWKYLKIFWIPVLLELMSIFGIWYSHGIMVKRNADLASAAVILTQQMDKYRARVRDKVGEETENDLFYGLTNKKVGEVTEDLGDGKTKKRPVYEKVMTDGAEGPFDRIFDRSNHNYQSTPGANMVFLNSVRKSCNDIMEGRATNHSNGWFLMSEVYQQLGYEPTAESFHWGWVWSKYDPKFSGTFIDFGISDYSNSIVHAFANGMEPAIPLHFNCRPVDVFKDLNLMKI